MKNTTDLSKGEIEFLLGMRYPNLIKKFPIEAIINDLEVHGEDFVNEIERRIGAGEKIV